MTDRVLYAQHRATGAPLTGATLVTSACDVRGELRGGPAWVELGGGRYKITSRGGDEQNCTIALIDFGALALQRYAVEVFHRNDNVNQAWAAVITDPTGALWPEAGDPPTVASYGWADGTDRIGSAPETFHLSELGPVWRWKPTRQDSERGASIVVAAPAGSSSFQFFDRAKPVLAVQTNIAVALNDALSADDGVTALVGTRIYPDELPQNEPVPAIVYTVIFDPKSSTFTGATLRSARVQIDVFARTVKDAGAVQNEVERVIGLMRTPSPGLSAVQETARSFFDSVTRYHRVEMEFTIWR
jgi:hypothetical protein